jgi:hypothetical protein
MTQKSNFGNNNHFAISHLLLLTCLPCKIMFDDQHRTQSCYLVNNVEISWMHANVSFSVVV